MLTKLMTVGCLGVFASMGLLLYTLKFVEQEVKNQKPAPISPLAFQSLLRQGEILECRADGNGLVGVRRGRRRGRTIKFAVKGPLSKRLIRELSRRKMLAPASAAPKSQPSKSTGTASPSGVGTKRPAGSGTKQPASDTRKVLGGTPSPANAGPLGRNDVVELPAGPLAPTKPATPEK